MSLCKKIALLLICLTMRVSSAEKLNFVTATDTEHYSWTLNLIAGIHRFHFDRIGEIAIYDLGLIPEERSHLNSLAYVRLYDVEQANPFIFQKFSINNKGKIARGWYSWKPVILKQAMQQHPEFFYLDSGITILGPLDLLFDQLHENGYFFIDCGHSIARMTTTPILKKFNLEDPANKWILDKKGISAGFQGLSKALYKNYILPIYTLAHDITNFEDDGSAPKGFGWSRHDQTLFSIQARMLNLTVQDVIRGGKLNLKDDGKNIKVSLDRFIEVTRGDFDLNYSKAFLKYKE